MTSHKIKVDLKRQELSVLESENPYNFRKAKVAAIMRCSARPNLSTGMYDVADVGFANNDLSGGWIFVLDYKKRLVIYGTDEKRFNESGIRLSDGNIKRLRKEYGIGRCTLVEITGNHNHN